MSLKGIPLYLRLLLITQTLFNVGFYLVVPFIAVYMTHSLAASSAAVGMVLGVRTFSQQGLFFLGGGLTDAFGPRPVILTGVAIRVVGFLVAGMADSVVSMTVGVVLIGIAAALFSPAVEATLAAGGGRLEHAGGPTRAHLFALDNAYGRLGALTGPVLGAILIPLGFFTTCMAGAVVFVGIFIMHAVVVHPDKELEAASISAHNATTPDLRGTWLEVIHNRDFMVFALLYSLYLVAYNMQYVALPVELRRALGSDSSIGWFFVIAAIYVIAAQTWITRVTSRFPRHTMLLWGFGIQSLSFIIVALCAPATPQGFLRYLIPLAFILTLHAGMMIAVPFARDHVAVLAQGRHLGSYFGILNSFGGCAVLIVSTIVGALLDYAETPNPLAAAPWALMGVLLAISAVGLYRHAARLAESAEAISHEQKVNCNEN